MALCLATTGHTATHYKIKQGDTLWDIAKAHKVSVDSILSANSGLHEGRLKLGATLAIPAKGSKPASKSGKAAAVKSKSARPTIAQSTYKVRSGDTLCRIAKSQGTTATALAKANGLSRKSSLHPGQILRVAPGPGSKIIAAGLNQTGVCISGRVNVRLGPGTQTERVALIDTGKPLTVVHKQGDWCQVSFASGTTGWVLSKYVQVKPSKAARKMLVAAKPVTKPSAKLSAKPNATAGSTAAAAAIAEAKNAGHQDQVVRSALSYRGSHYRRGGSSPAAFDCSGFTMYIYSKAGVRLPHNAAAQFGCGSPVTRSELKSGDLVFFHTRGRYISHVGIYIGSGSFVHASSARESVRVDTLDSGYYNSRLVGARRVR